MRYAVGAVLGLAALYACVASVNWPQFVDSFRSARASWVAAALLSIPISLALLTARWALLLDEGGSARSWQKLWDSVVVGQAVNIVFPLRFGEGARVVLTCRELGLPTGRVMIGLVLERTFDTAMFGAALMLVVAGGWIPRIGAADSTMVRATAVLALATVAALACAVWLLPARLDRAADMLAASRQSADGLTPRSLPFDRDGPAFGAPARWRRLPR